MLRALIFILKLFINLQVFCKDKNYAQKLLTDNCWYLDTCKSLIVRNPVCNLGIHSGM